MEPQEALLDFLHSIAHCFSADFKLGAGLAKQIKETFPCKFSVTKEFKQQVLNTQYLGNDQLVFLLIVEQRYLHKATYRSRRKKLMALRDQLSFYLETDLSFHICYVV